MRYSTGQVSAVCLGLQCLLHPLQWVGPFIPTLPFALAEFIESPVPLIAGLSLDSALSEALSMASVLRRCG
jgi:hypothetical protein